MPRPAGEGDRLRGRTRPAGRRVVPLLGYADMPAPEPPCRVFALMVVRDAADLLPVSIAHHLHQGVERFLVYDHQSVDETPRVLTDLARAGALEWARVEGPFCLERWLNELAQAAYLQGADWVLPLDADELWQGGSGRLVDALAGTSAAAVEVDILNFVQQHDQLETRPEGLLRMTQRVAELAPQWEAQLEAENGSLPVVALSSPPKWISRAAPGLRLRRGNHRVDGLHGLRVKLPDLVCLHAPLRSRAALARRRYPEALQDPALASGDSWHWRRWSRLRGEVEIDAEWAANSARDGKLLASGRALETDLRLRDAAARWLAGEPRRALAGGAARNGSGAAVGLDRARRLAQHFGSQVAHGESGAARSAGEVERLRETLAERDRDLAHLRLEADDLRHQLARREAEIAPRLDVLAAIEASRAHRLWMASIRLRRALRPRRAAPGPDQPRRLRSRLERDGFVAPLRVWDAAECRRILERLRENPPAAGEWGKDLAVTSREMYLLATCEPIRRSVVAALGADVVLWGASILVRPPGAVHPWHTDIETSSPAGGMVSVWIGVENTSRHSSLRVVPGSHRFGLPIQKVAAAHGRRRGEAHEPEIRQWARDYRRHSEIVPLDTGDGEAILFDGRLWHGTHNEGGATRTALLFQYARAAVPVRIPDYAYLDWPFRLLDAPRPRCILISGAAPSPPANRLVPPPTAESQAAAGGPPPLGLEARQLDLPLAGDPEQGWKPYQQFYGSTPNLGALSCHVSVLSPGRCPHPPHRHLEEELLVVLAGEAELVLVDRDGRERVVPVRPGDFSYYPAQQLHTLRTTDRSATYLMLKWSGRPAGDGPPLPAAVHRYDEQLAAAAAAAAPFAAQTVFEGPTRCLELLHCHCSAVAPGGGYEAHVDEHDVALIVLSGTIEVEGRSVSEAGVVFVPAGERHGMHNPGAATARYLVFELHGPRGA